MHIVQHLEVPSDGVTNVLEQPECRADVGTRLEYTAGVGIALTLLTLANPGGDPPRAREGGGNLLPV